MNKDSLIYIAGHRGMVGSAIVRALKGAGYERLIMATSGEMDLRDRNAVDRFFETHHPDYVFLAAARVGGIWANKTYPATFLYDNLMIQSNVMHAAYEHKVTKLLFLGSSCIYPKFAEQPVKEESLLSGYLEPTNDAYAIAKIAGIRQCDAYRQQYGCDFISAMPTNLYGYNDNYHPENAHVLPALIRRFHEAKESHASAVVVWGTGKPLREMMFVDDLAEACVFLMEKYSAPGQINVGTGEEVSIEQLAKLVARVVGYEGSITFDVARPDGTPRKLLDSGKLHKLGYRHTIGLEEGLRLTYEEFRTHLDKYLIEA